MRAASVVQGHDRPRPSTLLSAYPEPDFCPDLSPGRAILHRGRKIGSRPDFRSAPSIDTLCAIERRGLIGHDAHTRSFNLCTCVPPYRGYKYTTRIRTNASTPSPRPHPRTVTGTSRTSPCFVPAQYIFARASTMTQRVRADAQSLLPIGMKRDKRQFRGQNNR
jgi:hypothetical protein